MSAELRQFKLLSTAFVISFFIFVTLFGLNLSMQKDKMGKMSKCPFMINKTSICSMSFSNHLTKWQHLFTSANPANNILLMVILFASFLFFLIKKHTHLESSYASYAYRYYIDKHPDIKLYNYLQQAFSDGILHPKLYN